MPTNGMTIDGLNTVSSLTAQDEVPVWDKEASGEPTRKITAQNLTNSVKTLGSLVNTTEMNNAIAQSTAISFVEGGGSQTSVNLTTGSFKMGFLLGIHREASPSNKTGYAILYIYDNNVVVAQKIGLDDLNSVTYSSGNLTLLSSTGYKSYAFIKLG